MVGVFILRKRSENMAKFIKKPIPIEAYQTDEEFIIPTLEGEMKASVGDWIITGVDGEVYPCKPEIFEKTYEPFHETGLHAVEVKQGALFMDGRMVRGVQRFNLECAVDEPFKLHLDMLVDLKK